MFSGSHRTFPSPPAFPGTSPILPELQKNLYGSSPRQAPVPGLGYGYAYRQRERPLRQPSTERPLRLPGGVLICRVLPPFPVPSLQRIWFKGNRWISIPGVPVRKKITAQHANEILAGNQHGKINAASEVSDDAIKAPRLKSYGFGRSDQMRR